MYYSSNYSLPYLQINQIYHYVNTIQKKYSRTYNICNVLKICKCLRLSYTAAGDGRRTKMHRKVITVTYETSKQNPAGAL